MEITCPRCNRKAKLNECISKEKNRRIIVLNFPCYHFADLVYNVSYSTDNNTIMKDFKTIAKEYFDKTYYLSHFGERRL